MKNYGGSLKNPIFRGRFTKNEYIGKNCRKRGALKVCGFKGGLVKKRWVVFLSGKGGGVDTSMHTRKPEALLHKTHIKVLRLGLCTKFEKRVGRQYRGVGLHKIGQLGPLCQLCPLINDINFFVSK